MESRKRKFKKILRGIIKFGDLKLAKIEDKKKIQNIEVPQSRRHMQTSKNKNTSSGNVRDRKQNFLSFYLQTRFVFVSCALC